MIVCIYNIYEYTWLKWPHRSKWTKNKKKDQQSFNNKPEKSIAMVWWSIRHTKYIFNLFPEGCTIHIDKSLNSKNANT